MPENMKDSLDISKEAHFIKLPPSNSPASGSENINNHNSTSQLTESMTLSQPGDCGAKEIQLNGELLVIDKTEHALVTLAANNGQDSAVTSTKLQLSVEVNNSTIIENNFSAVQDGVHKRNGSPVDNHEIHAVSGTKRPRITVDEQQASVHVIYNSLTRESKRKLEEILHEWSEWDAQHNSSSRDSKNDLESGEGTYFPALNVGLDKPSAVSFWIDGQARNSQKNEVVALDDSSIPLYDRRYSFALTSVNGSSNLEGGLETVDAARCFNCGSYNHALKECPKPRDNAAVNSARKQHKTRRNQNSSFRNPTRYYQDTPGGKFDGLRPGVLDPETRKLLGLGELDPPPWLNRMRDIGYPPGYLDADEEEKPSGIEIFGDEVVTEDGEILDVDCSATEAPTKMSVEFPGVNAPIPENADEWRWGARAWNFDVPRNRYPPQPHLHDERWNRDQRNDGPPGVDVGSRASGFMPRYNYNPDHGSSNGRFMSDRSPLFRETSSSGVVDDDRWKPYSSEYRKDRHDHHSWR